MATHRETLHIQLQFWLFAIGWLIGLLCAPSPALAGAQAQRTVKEVKQLIADGKIPNVQRFGLDINANPDNGFFRPAAQTSFDEKVVAIPADGDVAVMYLRKDMMDGPGFQA